MTTFRTRNTLHLVLSAALTARRADILQHLFSSHGSSAFAQAIASRPSRQSADVLSMLAPTERTAVYRYLPKEARASLAEAAMTFACTHKKLTLSATTDGFLRKSSIADSVIGPTNQSSSSRVTTPWAAHPLASINSQRMGVLA